MSFRIALPLAAMLGAASPAFADSLTYTNARFGTHVTFPAELFETREEPPANGDGMKWTSSDGGSMGVFGSWNVTELSPADYLQQLIDFRGGEDDITYKRAGKDWVVISGTQGPDIFYERHEFGAQSAIHSVVLTYPRSLEAKYNPAVGPIANSLGGP